MTSISDLVAALREAGDPRNVNIGPSRALYRQAADALTAETKRADEAEAERDNLGESLRNYARLEALAQERAETAEAERHEARQLVTEANNSLYGSQGYFHSLNGGPFDKYHLATGIEKLKASSREGYRDEARASALQARVEALEERKSQQVRPWLI